MSWEMMGMNPISWMLVAFVAGCIVGGVTVFVLVAVSGTSGDG